MCEQQAVSECFLTKCRLWSSVYGRQLSHCCRSSPAGGRCASRPKPGFSRSGEISQDAFPCRATQLSVEYSMGVATVLEHLCLVASRFQNTPLPPIINSPNNISSITAYHSTPAHHLSMIIKPHLVDGLVCCGFSLELSLLLSSARCMVLSAVRGGFRAG